MCCLSLEETSLKVTKNTRMCSLTKLSVLVPKVGSFTWCAVCQYTHRAEVLSLLYICADIGAR